MNGTEVKKIPKFLEGEPLPPGYFDVPDPYSSHPTCKIHLGELGEYMRKTGKKSGWDLTKEEIKMFEYE